MCPADRYVIKRTIIKTLFGTLDLCEDTTTQQECAVKRSCLQTMNRMYNRPRPIAEDPRRACIILQSIPSHPNILPLLDSAEDDRFHYTITTYCKRGDLLDYILANYGNGLSESMCISFFKQALSAISHLHAHHIVHLDISAENFLLTEEHHIKLTDFGHARTLSPIHGQIDPQEFTSRPGKNFYMAPEVYERVVPLGPQADLYSLGILLYILCTNTYLYQIPCSKTNSRFAYLMKYGFRSFLLKYNPYQYSRLPPGALSLLSALICPIEKRWKTEQILNHWWLKEDK